MTTSVACKALHVTPPSDQYFTEQVSVIVGPKGFDQGQAVASELNVMEMSEVEYTHLQQIIQSHIEAETAEQEATGTGEDKLNPPSGERMNCRAAPASPVCHPNASLAVDFTLPDSAMKTNNHQGTEDVQEMNLTLYTETTGTADVEQRTPVRCADVPASVLEKLKVTVGVARNRGSHRRMPPLGSRPSPPARVCLEKRFSCGPCDLKRQQGAVLNTFISLLRQSTDMPGIAMHSQPEKMPRSERMGAGENSYEGNPPARGQGLGHFSEPPEGCKPREVIAPLPFSSTYSSDTTAESAFQSSCMIYAIDERQAASLDNEAVGKAAKPSRMRGPRPLQVRDPNILQTSENWKPAYTRAACGPRRRTEAAVESSERRARHNSKERERRRRIRLCCDELKLLVPFCNPETDKASTLQWTTAYLKYIRDIYGDSLKQDFQNAFCGETDIRIGPSGAQECENSASQD